MRSQLFYKKAKKIIQDQQLGENKCLSKIRLLFLEALGSSYHCASAQDLFDWQLNYICVGQKTYYCLIERLQNILDFLNNEGESLDFEREEVQLLINLIDESADKLPLKELRELMQTLLTKGLL